MYKMYNMYVNSPAFQTAAPRGFSVICGKAAVRACHAFAGNSGRNWFWTPRSRLRLRMGSMGHALGSRGTDCQKFPPWHKILHRHTLS